MNKIENAKTVGALFLTTLKEEEKTKSGLILANDTTGNSISETQEVVVSNDNLDLKEGDVVKLDFSRYKEKTNEKMGRYKMQLNIPIVEHDGVEYGMFKQGDVKMYFPK